MDVKLGERIRHFREKRGIGSAQLASEIGLSPSAMSLLESGDRTVKAEELAKIAEALSISPMAILDSDSLIANLPIAARVTDPTLATDGVLLNRLRFFAELVDLVSEFDVRPARPVDMPLIDIDHDWLNSARDLANWASTILEDWHVDENYFEQLIIAIETKLFIDVVVEDGSENDVLGASITDARLPLLIINANQRRQRALFTLAHELGHVLVGGGAAIIADSELVASNPNERFANAFAANLLLPEQLIRDALHEENRVPDALAKMLMKSGVSWQTLIYRLHNLRLVNATSRDALLSLGLRGLLFQIQNEDVQTSLQKDLRVDCSVIPHWLAETAILAYQGGAISIRPLASIAKMDADELLDAISSPETIDVDPEKLLEETHETAQVETDEELFAGIPA